MSDRGAIRIIRKGRVVEIDDFAPTVTLLDYLRLKERAVGTKEGCAEGDCGACTVALGRPDGAGGIVYKPVNACIQLLGMADGAEVVAVEDLAGREGLHPIQRELVAHHGSQCGFCTPGFVMALFALYHVEKTTPVSRQAVCDAIAGNLCRCTGYRPIVDAGLAACSEPKEDGFGRAETAHRLSCLESEADLFVGDRDRFFAAPRSVEALARLYLKHPDAVLVGGATDVGLWITKEFRAIDKIIHLGSVAALREVVETDDTVTIGAAATYDGAEAALSRLDPDVAEVLRRLGGKQIRAVGTVGGNIANGSPIGDTPPLLIALGAQLILQKGERIRELSLEDFFVAYGKQDRKPGEFVREVRIERPGPHTVFRAYKVSKRFDQDISALLGAFRLDLDGPRIVAARIAYGGMAGTPKRASAAETALVGADLADRASWDRALEALETDFEPISDHRASAAYRRRVARGLLLKALLEIAGTSRGKTRVIAQREGIDAAPA